MRWCFSGVNFGFNLNPMPRLADTLDVVLVQWRSESEPEKADYLAQASQKGGGETTETSRPSQPVSGDLPTPRDGTDMQESVAQTPSPQLDVREIITVDSNDEARLQQTTVEQPETEQPNASELMQQSMDMASMQPEISRQAQWKSNLAKAGVHFRKYQGV